MRRIATTAFLALLSVALGATSAAGAACDLSCCLGVIRSGCGAEASARPPQQAPSAMPDAGMNGMSMGQDQATAVARMSVTTQHSKMSSCLCQPDGNTTASPHLQRGSYFQCAQFLPAGFDHPGLPARQFLFIWPDASPPVPYAETLSTILRI